MTGTIGPRFDFFFDDFLSLFNHKILLQIAQLFFIHDSSYWWHPLWWLLIRLLCLGCVTLACETLRRLIRGWSIDLDQLGEGRSKWPPTILNGQLHRNTSLYGHLIEVTCARLIRIWLIKHIVCSTLADPILSNRSSWNAIADWCAIEVLAYLFFDLTLVIVTCLTIRSS